MTCRRWEQEHITYYLFEFCKNRFCTVWEIYFIRLMSSAEPFFYLYFLTFLFSFVLVTSLHFHPNPF